MKRKKKYLYIPIEVKKREFPAKIFLAYAAVNHGFDVIIGNSVYVQTIALHSVRGVYLGTSLLKSHGVLFDRLHKRRCKIVVCDEEGLVYYNKDNFIKHHANSEVAEKVDAVCAWGKHHMELLNKGGVYNVVVTGNVRFDLYRKEYLYLFEKNRIKYTQLYGKYILINTNLAAYNSYKGKHDFDDYLLDIEKVSKIDKSDRTFYYDKFEHQKRIYEEIIQLVNRIVTEIPDINIVIRPHPGEKIDFWKVFEDKRIIISREGDVIPWILGAQIVIQQNCTTGIEALVLNKPVISFIPEFDERFDTGLPNKMAKGCFSQEETIQNIKLLLNTKSEDGNFIDIYKKLGYYVNNVADKVCAQDLITQECMKNVVESNSIINKFIARFWRIAYDCYLRLFCDKETQTYFREKFNSLSLKEINDALGDNRMRQINVRGLCKDVFLMEKMKKSN